MGGGKAKGSPRSALPTAQQASLVFLFCALFWIGYSVWWVMPLALVPLGFLFGMPLSLPRRMLLGFAAGFLGLGLRQYFFGLISVPGLLALSVLEGFTVMLVAIGVGSPAIRLRCPMAFLLPVAWVGAEYWRTLGPCGLPNASLAWPCWQQLWLIQVCDLGGTYAITFAIAMFGGCVTDYLLAQRRFPISSGATLAVWLFIAGYGAFRLHEADTTMQAGPALTVVQPDIPTSTAIELAAGFDPLLFREQMLAWSAQGLAAHPRPAMIVWPETMTTMPALNAEWLESTSAEETGRAWRNTLRGWVDRSGVSLITGGPVQIPGSTPESTQVYNAATVFAPGAAQLRHQSKMRLFPIGEFVPWKGTVLHDWLDRWVNGRRRVTHAPEITPGERREIFPLGQGAPAFHYAIALCSEILFAETSTVFLPGNGTRKPVDFLVNISNDGFLQRTEGQMIHFHVLPFRAVEARIGIARSSNTGVSAFVKPTGEIYGEVVNARGEHWTGCGAPELPLIAELVKFRTQHEHELAGNPALADQVRGMIARIETLRAEAGITGQSTQPVYVDSRRTLYSRSGDAFAKGMFGLLLLGLAGAALGSLGRRFPALGETISSKFS